MSYKKSLKAAHDHFVSADKYLQDALRQLLTSKSMPEHLISRFSANFAAGGSEVIITYNQTPADIFIESLEHYSLEEIYDAFGIFPSERMS